MARIFQFPLQPRMRKAQMLLKRSGAPSATWKEHPILLPLYLLMISCIFIALCCWPLLQWLLVIDIVFQLIRIGFSDGWGQFCAVMHLALIAVFACAFLLVGTTAQRRR